MLGAVDGGRAAAVLAVPVIIAVALYVWWERKVHRLDARAHGTEQVGPAGLAQTFADVFKLLLKEVISSVAMRTSCSSCSRR